MLYIPILTGFASTTYALVFTSPFRTDVVRDAYGVVFTTPFRTPAYSAAPRMDAQSAPPPQTCT